MPSSQMSESMEKALQSVATRMSSLRHPNTVLFMGVCLRDQEFCIVSEYCSRGSLYDILRRYQLRNDCGLLDDKSTQLHWSLRCRLALGAARGLLYLHSASPPLVHGQLTRYVHPPSVDYSHVDLRSLNILVDDSWNAKLGDFGTQKVSQAISTHSEARRNAPRTRLPYWTAPEVFKEGQDSVETTSTTPQGLDVYSFG
ncbi:hypothetical protein AC1031_010999 [Aphanomyces cochlioides]|nr:hypothetical protein AC1031_010999 [Aphanomyces cochlioides]